ncbi:MAG: hemerythrin domain-containing protein [Hydrogenophaga sp.]|uniref:hemerythrin domain-containing protein n=1 Tax=Hydrogenophaga sp. TaxID=1904254 RepID=UPI003D135E14
MNTFPLAANAGPASANTPITNFTDCHAGILRQLRSLDELASLLSAAQRARQIATEALGFFREAVFEHHVDEERELFPAVLASAGTEAERNRVKAMTERLTLEHRAIEKQWKSLEKPLKYVAKGQDADLDVQDLYRLVETYAAHAGYEEAEFLPLAQEILSRNSNHMAALGLSLHMKHVPQPPAYI